MNRFVWLLKREYWEHRGGFLWAPIWITGVMIVLTLMGIITAEVFKSHFVGGVSIGVSLQDLTSKLSPEDLAQVGPAIDLALLSMGGLLHTVLFFVLFFYLLGALYDDRRDRSVLFWKSLPVSDTATVASKVVTAMLVAPLLTFVGVIVLQLAVLVIVSVYVMAYGINPLTVIWGPASPLNIWAQLLVNIPVNALWALPTVGWLLLVSAFARSKPFLWALLVPIGVGVLVSWFDVLSTFSIPDVAYWQHVASRLLLGVAPNAYLLAELGAEPVEVIRIGNAQIGGLGGDFGWAMMGRMLMNLHTWIGAAAGVAMLAGAVYLRRWRDEG